MDRATILVALIAAASLVKYSFVLAFVAFFAVLCTNYFLNRGDNPFTKDSRQPRRPYVYDLRSRDDVIKQSFRPSKILPGEKFDAIVIGSGIGGLTTAVLLSKVGKRVIVLEQHDQAGGCCHTFVDKGYEFDTGIHYIGEIAPGRLNRTFVDHITDGQVEWAKLDEEYDVVNVGYGEDRRQYGILGDEEKWKARLKKDFPDDTEAVDKFFAMLQEVKIFETINGAMKIVPLWLAWIVAKTGLLKLFTRIWSGIYEKSTLEIVKSLTDNKDLQAVMSYCWGDFGSPPSKSHFIMQGLLHRHFMDCGGYYPVGGASEIAFNMIPIIEKAGGKVFVKANVTAIVCEAGKAVGVAVEKNAQTTTIRAPLIISGAGAYNTFFTLLPRQVAETTRFAPLLKSLKPGLSSLTVFVGLDASAEELGLKAKNLWSFTSNDLEEFDRYLNLSREEMTTAMVPLMFMSFPSQKDPNWNKREGRKFKSTCCLVTLANWDWYKEWQNMPLKKRGDDYEATKKAVADQMIEQACTLVPQIRHHIDYIEIGSPVTNKHYLGQPNGEIYGLDHGMVRMDPWTLAQLRPKTDIEGLYLTGQDALLCGFTGALFGGLLCAGSILGRNVMGDLEALHATRMAKEANNMRIVRTFCQLVSSR